MISVYQSLYSLAEQVSRFSAAVGIVMETATGQYFCLCQQIVAKLSGIVAAACAQCRVFDPEWGIGEDVLVAFHLMLKWVINRDVSS